MDSTSVSRAVKGNEYRADTEKSLMEVLEEREEQLKDIEQLKGKPSLINS